MNKTKNLGLNKPTMADLISHSVEDVFGGNFDVIDEEIAELNSHASDTDNPHGVLFNQTIVQLDSSADLNNIPDGLFLFRRNTTHAPVQGAGLVMQVSPNGGAKFQLAVHDVEGNSCIYNRYNETAGWSAWGSSFRSPSFTGIPTAPTAKIGSSSTQLATTEFVANAISGIIIPEDTSALAHTHTNKMVLDGITAADIDDWDTLLERFNTHTLEYNPHNVTKAQVGLGNVVNESKTMMFTSPTFTGTPTAPTAAKDTNTKQIATTEFVQDALEDIVVTKEAVGLGNVPNVSTNDQTPTYTEGTEFETRTSGEKISIAFGKIKLAITSLINHIANKSNPHSVTKSQIGLGNVTNESKTAMFTSPTFTGTPKVSSSSAYTTAKLRNIVFWTSGTTAPTTSNGDIVIKTF
ncbi:MAG: hypothetical protein ACI4EA_01975 [Candidatus Ornithomonoglobus sp.]